MVTAVVNFPRFDFHPVDQVAGTLDDPDLVAGVRDGQAGRAAASARGKVQGGTGRNRSHSGGGAEVWGEGENSQTARKGV